MSKGKMLSSLFVVISVIFFACSHKVQCPIEPISLNPGSFQLTKMDGLAKSIAGANLSATNLQIDIGSIKSSRDFYFLLRNVGDFEIDSVSLSIVGNGFSVSPAQIAVLSPENARSREVGLSPIIRITVTHGEAIDGIGWVGVLPKGENTATLSIIGKTKNAQGNDTSTSLAANLTVDAKIMDMKVFANNTELILDWDHSCGNIGDRENGFWQHCFDSAPLAFVNSGNVPIQLSIQISKCFDSIIDSTDTTLQADDTLVFPIHDSTANIFMTATSSNTITDISRLPLSALGEARKQFIHMKSICK